MVLLSYLSVLEFKGNDASQFLQNQLSADIQSIPEGAAGFACTCNPQGRVLGLMLVRPQPDGCLAICAAPLAEMLAAQLSRFVFRLDVSISLRPDGVLAGPANPRIALTRFSNETGMEYAVLAEGGVEPAPDHDTAQGWKAQELGAGIAWLAPETSGRYLPQMLGYESIGALSFRKGCYPGQEIIARTRYLGKLKRHPVHCRTQGPFEFHAGDTVTLTGTGGDAKAEIVDFADAGAGVTEALLVARMDESFSPGALLSEGRRIEAEFAAVDTRA